MLCQNALLERRILVAFFGQFMIQFSRAEMSGLVANKWGREMIKGIPYLLKKKLSFIFFIIFNYNET